VVLKRTQAVPLQQFSSSFLGECGWHSLERREVGDDGRCSHLLVETFFLGQVADAATYIERSGSAEDGDGSRGGAQDVEHHPDACSLPGTIRTEKAADGSLGYCEGNIIYSIEITVRFGDIDQFNRCSHDRLSVGAECYSTSVKVDMETTQRLRFPNHLRLVFRF